MVSALPDTLLRMRRISLLVPVLAAVLLLAGCSGGSGSAKGSSDDPSPSASGAASSSAGAQSSVDWKACDSGFECGTVTVPLDYDDPDATTIKLALLRRPATDTAHRIGSLLVNPGGPGGSGIDLAKSLSVPAKVSARFDIVGFDPRGVGRSEPKISCHTYLQKMYDTDPTFEDAADRTAYLSISKKYVDECATKEKGLLAHLGTLDVARDMDRIRQAVGDDKLNYLGYSYGTSIGQMYAQLFPTKIRTMVLDGVVDTEKSGLQGADEQAVGFEKALKAYLADCKSDPSCVLGAEPRAKVKAVIAASEKQPIPAASADRPATPGVIQLAIGAALYNKQSWPVLSQAITSGLAGDGSTLVALADSYLMRNQDGSYGNGFDIYFAVGCLDSTWPRDPDKVFANAKSIAAKAPLLGEGLVNDYVRCSLWPVKPEPLPDVSAKGSPPIVVVSTTRDPATPYESGVKVAGRLPQGVLLTNDGDGHTVTFQGKACVDDAISTYLLDEKAPKNGARCS